MTLSPRTIIASLLLHVLVLVLFWLFASPSTLPEPPKVMQAVLMSVPPGPPAKAPAAAPAPAPAPEPLPPPVQPKPPVPPKPEPATKPVVPPKPKPEAVLPAKKPEKPKPKIDDQRLDQEMAEIEAEASRVKAADDARRKREAELRQQALAQALKDEAEAMAADAAAAARARQMAAQIGEFQIAINKKIKSLWRRPANVTGKLVTEMRITLLPGGEVASVLITRSSGNQAFDASAEEAVRRASPLPVPSDPLLFREQFKVLILKFKPEE